MSDPNLPASALTAIEQRVKRRIRRQFTMGMLTLALTFALFMAAITPSYDGRFWGMLSGLLLLVWIPYTLWYIYRALIERGIRREIERERQHQLQLVREGGRVKREDRFSHLIAPENDGMPLLDDDGELWAEDDLPLERKPKRRLDAY